jgi:hypothetical protein
MQKEVTTNPFVHAKIEQDGTAMWAGLQGNSVSSTRTELAAIVVASLWNMVLHIGTDSLAVVRKATFLISTAIKWNAYDGIPAHTRRNPCKRPWSMQPDGDLWQQFWQAILTRGPATIRITKVKGHATDQDIKDGKSNEVDRKGNDEADKAATAGTGAVMDGLAALASWIHDRHVCYCKFMHRVHTVIIAVQKAENKSDLSGNNKTGSFTASQSTQLEPLRRALLTLHHHRHCTFAWRHCRMGTTGLPHFKYSWDRFMNICRSLITCIVLRIVRAPRGSNYLRTSSSVAFEMS